MVMMSLAEFLETSGFHGDIAEHAVVAALMTRGCGDAMMGASLRGPADLTDRL
jgi:hypothetical protein